MHNNAQDLLKDKGKNNGSEIYLKFLFHPASTKK